MIFCLFSLSKNTSFKHENCHAEPPWVFGVNIQKIILLMVKKIVQKLKINYIIWSIKTGNSEGIKPEVKRDSFGQSSQRVLQTQQH